MAAVEIVESLWIAPPRESPLRLVEAREHGRNVPTLSQRRAARARLILLRRRLLAGLALVISLGILAMPGRSFGGVTDTGLPTDLASGSTLAPGSVYVVHSGDTLYTIARQINPLDVTRAAKVLAAELGSSVVVAGEHVLIP